MKVAFFTVKTRTYDNNDYYWDENKFKSSRVAKMLGISVETLKHREARGFYPEPEKHPHSYYRYYSIEEIEILKDINRKNGKAIQMRRHLYLNCSF